MNRNTKTKLYELAQKYEISSFSEEDPSQFLCWYDKSRVADVEVASFIAAMLAFGNRKQFIPKIRWILELADGNSPKENAASQWGACAKEKKGIAAWCLAGAPNFPYGIQKFYRFYSYDDLHTFFSEIARILTTHKTLGNYFKEKWEEGKKFPCLQPALQSSATPLSGLRRRPQRPLYLSDVISTAFPKSAIVPKGINSANKRIHMFLRWMVRQNSPVDLGLWSWYPSSALIIPLDVHVMKESINLGLLSSNAKATFKTALELTKSMEEVFPGDPCRADYALFGLGVDSPH